MITLEECFKKHRKLIYVGGKRFINAAYMIGMENDDIISEGSIALIKAYNQFDDTKGFKFSTYAVKTIYGHLSVYFRDHQNMIRYSRRSYMYANQIRRQGLQDKPVSEIAERLGISVSAAAEAIKSTEIAFSLNARVSMEETDTLLDMLGSSDDHSVMYVNEFVNHLNKTEQTIIRLLLQGKTHTEISKVVKFSQPYVTRIIKKLGKKYMNWRGLEVSA